jgi:hypothetical protein
MRALFDGRLSGMARSSPEHRETVLTFVDVVGSGHGAAAENIAESLLPAPK